ncbi:hypothetical protein ACQ4PT_055322 [Festuca glaucescens]
MAQMSITEVAIAGSALLMIILMPLLPAGGAEAAGDRASPAPVIPIGMPSCVRSCGGVDVPYPFGTGTDARCYLPGFNLTCDNSTGRLLLDVDGTLQVLNIAAHIGFLKAQHIGAVKIGVSGLRRDGPYTLWRSELILIGCNVQATVKSGNVTVAGCTSLCEDAAADDDENGSVTDDRCYGSSTGCCRANIVTPGYDGSSTGSGTSSAYDVQLTSLGGRSRNRSTDLPVRVFVAYNGWFDNSSLSHDLLHRSWETMSVPFLLSWEVVGQAAAQPSSLCKSNHSERRNGTRGGYTCTCKDGYRGNPYITDGCKDDDECKMWSQEENGCYGECINTEGSYMCQCPTGTTGDYSIPGGCVNDTTLADTGSCMRWCGDVEVPYPFGIGPSKCNWPGFDLTCDMTDGPPRLLLGRGHFRVVNISLLNTTVRVIGKAHLMPNKLFNADGIPQILGRFPSFFERVAPYSLSTVNELILTGCNAQATLLGHGNPAIISGCASFCSKNDTATTGTLLGVVGWPTNGIHGGSGSSRKYCYGMGCCQARISESMDGMPKELRFQWFDTSKPNLMIRLPGFVFIAEDGWFDRPSVAGKLMMQGQDVTSAENLEVPLLLKWEVLLLNNGTSSANVSSSHPDCDRDQVAQRLCKSKQSHCEPGKRGYSCQCNDGYQGNPYVLDGCKGSFPYLYMCKSIIIGVASGAGLILLVLISYFISKKFKHHRAQMLKRKYFEQNRGQLLQQLVSQRADIAEKMIITLEELEKATNNFDKARELGGGGHGTVYKGILSDLHVVAIKKPKMVVQREIDEFINEVAILSQINHRNVVKLYSCCLETEVPLLVYEFISNGTLYDHLHVEGPISMSWGDRLRIAIETAKSLAYLHSTTSIPIIHRDIKPANILLDDTLTAKVADFGASRYIPLDKSGLTTAVQGTLGYLDPMYFYTWRLTEKSDVYSFGVMLIEMMTRKKPLLYMASEGNGLVAHFATLFADGNLMQILDPQVMSEGGDILEEIAGIAVACVQLRGEERPTMRQVELRLEAAQWPNGFEVTGDVAENSPFESREESTSRQYSMEEEYITSARYPR